MNSANSTPLDALKEVPSSATTTMPVSSNKQSTPRTDEAENQFHLYCQEPDLEKFGELLRDNDKRTEFLSKAPPDGWKTARTLELELTTLREANEQLANAVKRCKFTIEDCIKYFHPNDTSRVEMLKDLKTCNDALLLCEKVNSQ